MNLDVENGSKGKVNFWFGMGFFHEFMSYKFNNHI